MAYLVLSDEEQDVRLVRFLGQQEDDHALHVTNIERFTIMLANPALPPTYRQVIEDLLRDTHLRLNEVAHIMNATIAQLPPADRLQAAIARVKASRV